MKLNGNYAPLKQLLAGSGLSQKIFAEKCGVPASAISAAIKNRVDLGTVYLWKIAQAYECELTDIVLRSTK